jgi:signal transduction histidine kinase/ActR/RegA family two-component response regulator
LTFRPNLKVKFTLTICCLLACAVVSLGWIFLLQVEKSSLRALRDKGMIVARNLADSARLGVFTHNTAQLEMVLAPLREQGDVLYAAVADEEGRIVAEHRGPGLGTVPVWAGGAADGTTWTVEVEGTPERAYFIVTPIRAGRGSPVVDEAGVFLAEEAVTGVPDADGRVIGSACVGMTAAGVLREMRGLRQGLVLATLAVLVVGVGIAIVLVRVIVGPIKYLVHATERIAHGDLEILLPGRGRDEIGALAESFNQMTVHLRESRQALEASNQELERKVQERTRALKDAQKQLIQAEKMSVVGQLVSGVAHELNNPLAGVLGYSQLLMRRGAEGKVREGLQKIEAEAERCRRIVQNLLIFARKHKPQMSLLDVNAVIESTLEMRGYHLKTDNVTVVRDLDPRLPKTMADTNQVQQVLMNVINNAHHAMLEVDRPRRLAVRTAHREGRIAVEVADNGSGIPQEHLSRIFDPFFTTKEVGRGTGLGLSICYGIIQEHGGDIRVDSHPGSGTTFTIELPVVEWAMAGTSPEAAIQEALGPPAHRGRILLVDDEASILEVIGDVLRLDGHEVVAETNGATALERLRGQSFDVIVTDLKMPGMSGQELFARLTEIDPALARRLVFATGDLASPETILFLERTGNPYLQKPFDLNAVRRIVTSVLASAMAA